MVTLLEHYFQNLNVICVIKCFQSISCQSVFWNFCILEGFVYNFCNNYTNHRYSENYSMSSTERNVLYCIKMKLIFCYMADIN